ncbi:hypothetical protein HBE96_05840 [Clostridium sp. P21]|uniref:GTPase-associated system helical domain-containing protein n=1 Tax=Clostridium muellerianum TaxID=2716538 RepID=A0A7Y0EF35_9CLOT|nr:GTPase-associated system all-helical protein GASH [Clostridium muellerianum]NMM62213.1 hypothetical protein [Clostridium muellerianum]
MKDKFCEWYKFVCLDPTHEQLKNRWDSLQEYCENEDINVLELTKLFFGLPTEEAFKAEFVESYSNRDMTFLYENEREISMLAGATLMELLEKNIQVTNIVLAIMCIALFKQESIIPEVIDIVSDKLDDIATDIRKSETEHSMRYITNKGISELAKTLESGTFTPESIIAFSKTLGQIVSNFNILQNNQENMEKSLEIYKEDSDILSWLFGEWSNDLKKQLNKKVNQNQISLVIGKELADLVKLIPGPYAAKAFLRKMLGHCKVDKNNITLVEIIDLLDEDWKKQLLNDYSIIGDGENTPILLAISKSLETSEQNVWKYAYQKVMEINVEEVKSDPLTWSYQMYLECLLVKDNISEE